MNRRGGPCLLCGETAGRAATEQAQMFGSDLWFWLCAPCARVERAETAYIMALAGLIDDDELDDETGGAM